MAVRADFNVNVLLGRTRRPGMPAGAYDLAFDIFWMNSFFHSHFSFYLNKIIICNHNLMSPPAKNAPLTAKSKIIRSILIVSRWTITIIPFTLVWLRGMYKLLK